jgi:hypothetical protein
MNYDYVSSMNLLINRVLYSESFFMQWYARKYNNEKKLNRKEESIKEIISKENPILRLRCKLMIGGSWVTQVIFFSDRSCYIEFDDCELEVQQKIMEMVSLNVFTNAEKNMDSNFILYSQMMFDQQLGNLWKREDSINVLKNAIKRLERKKKKAIKNIDNMQNMMLKKKDKTDINEPGEKIEKRKHEKRRHEKMKKRKYIKTTSSYSLITKFPYFLCWYNLF